MGRPGSWGETYFTSLRSWELDLAKVCLSEQAVLCDPWLPARQTMFAVNDLGSLKLQAPDCRLPGQSGVFAHQKVRHSC